MPQIVDEQMLVTGASGRVARVLRSALRHDHELRLTDSRPLDDLRRGESFVQGDLTCPEFAAGAVSGVTAIIHLAAQSFDADWPRLLRANIEATTVLCEAARREGVATLIFASSVHAVGGYNEPAQWPVPLDAPPRPCCRYGASKVAGEAIVRLYSDQVPGARTTCLRLPLVTYLPRTESERRSWLAEADLVSVVEGVLAHPSRFAIHLPASPCPEPRFAVDHTLARRGHRPTVPATEVPMGPNPPTYAPDCVLWRPTTDDQGVSP